MTLYHPLPVVDVEQEIETVTTLAFEVPETLDDVFCWRPGQHLNVRFFLEGEELRRSYSISSSPVNNSLRITVKRVREGRVSNHINDHVRPGDTIEAMAPSGGFCLDPRPDARRTHYFFGAGSGMTPLYSMLTSVLAAEPHSYVKLLYGNQSDETIIFRDVLARLLTEYPERFQMVHSLSKPRYWSSFDAWKGRLDAAAVGRFIDLHPPYAQDVHYYICGPGKMNAAIKKALMDLDVPTDRIHSESYGGAETDDPSVVGVDARVHVELSGEARVVDIPQGETVLRALLNAGLAPPYSCEAGVCSTCRAKITAGAVHLKSRAALEDAEIERGEILTCQAIPTTSDLSIHYEDL